MKVAEVNTSVIIKQGRRDKATLLRKTDVIIVPESFFKGGSSCHCRHG